MRAFGGVAVDETEICERGNCPVNLGLEVGLNAKALTSNKLGYLSGCVDSSKAGGWRSVESALSYQKRERRTHLKAPDVLGACSLK